MESLKRILIGDKTYPFRIDLNVLEHIQEEYGAISRFERELIGVAYKKDREGQQLYDEKGEALFEAAEPSIRAIKAVLPIAINEGITIEADAQNKEAELLTSDFIFQNCTIGFQMLSEMLHEEFRRCFATKK